MMISLRPGMNKDRDEVISKLMRYNIKEMTWISSEAPSGYGETFWKSFRQTVERLLSG